MKKPQFVTFTGLDDRVDVDRVIHLSNTYPIEWGVLFGNRIEPRYPKIPERFLQIKKKNFNRAVHLCGRYSQNIMRGNFTPALEILENGFVSRIQVNSRDYDLTNINRFQMASDKPVIIQIRGSSFPVCLMSENVHFLHDESGGKGVVPDERPKSIHFAGYAGGIGPENVIEVLNTIEADSFWIDMETKIRTDDWLDLDKCEAVCKAIWS